MSSSRVEDSYSRLQHKPDTRLEQLFADAPILRRVSPTAHLDQLQPRTQLGATTIVPPVVDPKDIPNFWADFFKVTPENNANLKCENCGDPAQYLIRAGSKNTNYHAACGLRKCKEAAQAAAKKDRINPKQKVFEP